MKIIDLSMEISREMEIYPGDPKVKIEQVHYLETHGWNLREITMGTHTGTHVDSFSHMNNKGFSLDEIPIEKFMGQTILISPNEDFPSKINLFFDEEVGIEILDKIKIANPNFVGGKISIELEKALLENEIITYTNLINLDKLPKGKEFLFIGLPLKIKKGDGSPVRAVAILS
ncbi:MAG: cyclase family protein [Tissierellia bacterium]|jgi:arylformamidase|nr:cyclase family protein [Tissierellia bacterium]